MKIFVGAIIVGVMLILIVLFGLQFPLQQCIVHQTSMIPTLQENQRIFISKISYFSGGPNRGDIIVFRYSRAHSEIAMIKRVIGLPGETIEIKSSVVYIDGSPLEEPYIEDRPNYVLDAFTVPEQNYFVLGDNRNFSADSHEGWTIPEANIVGKALISIWPPNALGLFPSYVYATDKPSLTRPQ